MGVHILLITSANSHKHLKLRSAWLIVVTTHVGPVGVKVMYQELEESQKLNKLGENLKKKKNMFSLAKGKEIIDWGRGFLADYISQWIWCQRKKLDKVNISRKMFGIYHPKLSNIFKYYIKTSKT